ncbi:ABC transporter ATP-binding protein [Tissierella creatinini]|nr:ABC transporter ATP-binding protein [Tissierella creatinini]TJX61953.1 ABC transporter ATP-binding protein [Soehngenia saccharolytica]
MLEIKGISASYGATEVLHEVSLKIEKNKITTLIGGNGAGKSTTLNCIMGIVKATKGSIILDGKDITKLRTPEIVKLGISLIPEGRHIFPNMTVMENLEMGAYSRKDSKAELKNDIDSILDFFPILKTRYKQLAGTMSGGEQQMLAIGRSLMGNPQVILMDEPSMGLAPIVVEEVFNIIDKIQGMGKTILLVEQNATLALNYADYGYVIELGNIALEGTGKELLSNPEVEKAYLGL